MKADAELAGIELIRKREGISLEEFKEFLDHLGVLNEEEIYDLGMKLVHQCTHEQQLHIFTSLFLLSEIDGRVHRKEIRLLIYSLHDAGISFETIVNLARQAGPLLEKK